MEEEPAPGDAFRSQDHVDGQPPAAASRLRYTYDELVRIGEECACQDATPTTAIPFYLQRGHQDLEAVLDESSVSTTSLALINGKANHTEQLKFAASYHFDAQSSLLFHPTLQYYFDPNTGLYYEPNTGMYMRYDIPTNQFAVHSVALNFAAAVAGGCPVGSSAAANTVAGETPRGG